MEELDSSSHIGYFSMITTKCSEANDRESSLQGIVMAANNARHAHSRRDWNPCGNSHDLLHEGVTPTKWRSIQVLLSGVLTWLKQQVCTETLMILAVRMH